MAEAARRRLLSVAREHKFVRVSFRQILESIWRSRDLQIRLLFIQQQNPK